MRKTLILSFALISFVTASTAQIKLPGAVNPVFAEKLAKIAEDFRYNYYNIQGAQLPLQEDVDTYQSTVELPGAKHCVIYRFHSKVDTTASWQATMYAGDSYKEAWKVYKNTCKQVDRTRIKTKDNGDVPFTGKTEEPDENLRFVSSVFTIKSKDAAYENFYAEVELVNITFDQWEVHLSLQSKKDDTEK